MYEKKLFHTVGFCIATCLVQQCIAMQQPTETEQLAATALLLLSQKDVSDKKIHLKFVLNPNTPAQQKSSRKVHKKERPYLCDVCHYAFKRPEHLRRHLLLHSGETPYGCTKCTNLFSRKDALNEHIRKHHTE